MFSPQPTGTSIHRSFCSNPTSSTPFNRALLVLHSMLTVKVDDSDLSVLTYSGGWTAAGSGFEYNMYVLTSRVVL